MSGTLEERYQEVLHGIEATCGRAGRDPHGVCLVAVSKTVELAAMRVVHGAGQRDFGESRVQEALPKIGALPDDITWHFIGRLQKNKVRRIVSEFRYIHSVDSLKMACFMDGVAGELGVKPRVFLQVNLAEEETKGGFDEAGLEAAIAELLALPHLEIIGLMCLPPYAENPEDSRMYFRRLRELRDRLEKTHGCGLPHLSMGMSHDYAVAIEEGATFVRVGSSLFGEREYAASGADSSPSTI